ncbi:MAG: hypothetical protein ABIQ44_07765, partial [Chloroflexia bacterium]
FASNTIDASTRDLAYERSYHHLRRKRSDARDSNDSLQMYVGCIAIIAAIHGLSLIVGPSIGMLLTGWPLLLLIGGVCVGALFKVLFDLRYGYSLTRSLTEVIVFGVVVYALMYGVLWYFSANVLKPGQPLFNFKALPTATPHTALLHILS